MIDKRKKQIIVLVLFMISLFLSALFNGIKIRTILANDTADIFHYTFLDFYWPFHRPILCTLHVLFSGLALLSVAINNKKGACISSIINVCLFFAFEAWRWASVFPYYDYDSAIDIIMIGFLFSLPELAIYLLILLYSINLEKAVGSKIWLIISICIALIVLLKWFYENYTFITEYLASEYVVDYILSLLRYIPQVFLWIVGFIPIKIENQSTLERKQKNSYQYLENYKKGIQ